MKDNDDIKIIGEKLRAEYLSYDMEEGPSPEMVARWIAIADQRRTRIHRRKKMLLSVASCAAVLLLCIGVTVTCIVKPSSAVAGNEGGTKIESGFEMKDVYKSESDIPADVKEEFLLFPYIPEGYEFSEATVEEIDQGKNILLAYSGNKNNEIIIKENITNKEIAAQNLNKNAQLKKVGEIEVYVTQYEKEKLIYSFNYEDLTIMITVPQSIENEVTKIIEKATGK